MTKKVDVWMPFLIDKYLGDTTDLTTEQHGAYMLLLLTMWKRDGKLPSTDSQLAAIAKLSPARWRSHKPILMQFFRPDGDHLTQKRLTIELVRAKKTSQSKSDAGKKGAEARYGQDEETLDSDGRPDGSATGTTGGTATGKRDGTAIANGQQEVQQTGTPIPIPTPRPEQQTLDTNPDPDDSGAIAPAADAAPARLLTASQVAELTKAELWSVGKSLLATQGMPKAQCGSFVGKLVRDYTDAVVIEAVRSAVVNRPADVAEFLVGACKAAVRPKGMGKSDAERHRLNEAANAELALRFGGGAGEVVDATP